MTGYNSGKNDDVEAAEGSTSENPDSPRNSPQHESPNVDASKILPSNY